MCLSSEAQAHRQRDLRTLEFLFKINCFPIHYVYNCVKHDMVFYRFLCMGSFCDVLCITVTNGIIVLMASRHKDKRTKTLCGRCGFLSESAEAKKKKENSHFKVLSVSVLL